jgi:hypothetical protein
MNNKIGIVGMLSNISTSINHHGGGYHRIMTQMIKDSRLDADFEINVKPKDWCLMDELYFLEGVNFQGIPVAQIGDQVIKIESRAAYNIPGGPQQEHYDKLAAYNSFVGPMTMINNYFDFEQYAKRLKKVVGQRDIKYDNLAINFGLHSKKCVIGDSHSLSVWKRGSGLDRTDGKTLWNFLNTSDPEKINEKYNETITYFGNIDLRFHLHRQENPEKSTKELFERYVEFSNKLTNNVVALSLPIEHESRKLPGTGLYKGQPFFGTRDERMHYRQIGVDILKSSGIKLVEWPEEWAEGDGTKMFEVMEPRQSVHLRPLHYYFNDIKNV